MCQGDSCTYACGFICVCWCKMSAMKANRCRWRLETHDVVVWPRSFSRAPLDTHLHLQPVVAYLPTYLSCLQGVSMEGGTSDRLWVRLGLSGSHLCTIIAIIVRNFMTRVGGGAIHDTVRAVADASTVFDFLEERIRANAYVRVYAPYDRLFIHASRSDTCARTPRVSGLDNYLLRECFFFLIVAIRTR